jgi:hypothetical protein
MFSIGAHSFAFCSSLEVVDFGNETINIEQYYFRVYQLISVNQPDSLDNFHQGIFYPNPILLSATLGKHISNLTVSSTYINYGVFSNFYI